MTERAFDCPSPEGLPHLMIGWELPAASTTSTQIDRTAAEQCTVSGYFDRTDDTSNDESRVRRYVGPGSKPWVRKP